MNLNRDLRSQFNKGGLCTPREGLWQTREGTYRVRFTDRKTGALIKEIIGKQLIVTSGKALVGDILIGRTGYDTGLTVCALGTGTTAPALTDTTLETEVARKLITSRTRTGTMLTFTTYFAYSECTFNISEAAIFGHSTAAVETLDSGEMFSRWLLSFDNSSGDADVTVDYMLPVG